MGGVVKIDDQSGFMRAWTSGLAMAVTRARFGNTMPTYVLGAVEKVREGTEMGAVLVPYLDKALRGGAQRGENGNERFG